MKLGIYSDLRNPAGWRRGWSRSYGRTLERVEEAERLGLGAAFFTEHHLFEDGYMPQPLTFAAAAAARTERIRIGTAVMLATLRPAIDTAEQAAVVDILSGGRLELGLGTGYRVPEFEAFGVDMSRRYALLEERCEEIRRLWEGGRLSPPPVQERLPLWIGAEGPRGARLAGRVGAGLMTLRGDLLDAVRAGRAKAGDLAPVRLSGPVNLILADDPERTWAELEPFIVHQAQTYRAYGAEGKPDEEAEIAGKSINLDWLRSTGPEMNPPRIDVVTPAEAARRMREWLGPLPVEYAFFWESIAGMPDVIADRHLELIGTDLAALLEDDDGPPTDLSIV
ncbi:MAG TPA: LLM class flavin-dependent oxidoreductase [Solirubrobacterales bacterium]|nr:LLM class flavin-dependent oxidoreductase [Solirubrobacterales bacterium]